MILKISDYVNEPVVFTAIVGAVATLYVTFRRKNQLPKTALLDAAMNKDLEKVKKLLSKKKVDVNQINSSGFTVLIAATIKMGQKYIIEELLDKGALLDWQDRNGNTALHYAVLGNKKTLIKVFVERGANLSLLNDEGKTPMDIARDKGKPDLVELLEN